MKSPLSLLALALVLLAGCGKSSTTTPTPPSSGSGNPAADYGSALVRSKALATKTVDLASLNSAVALFNTAEGRNPKDLDELVQSRYIAFIPDAPPGKKIVYDAVSGQIQIVDQ